MSVSECVCEGTCVVSFASCSVSSHPIMCVCVCVCVSRSVSRSMAPLAMLISVFLSTLRAANTVAFVFFIVGFLLQSFLSSFGVTLLYDPSTTPIPKDVFVFYPPFNFAKALSDLAQKAYPTFDSNLGKYVPGYDACESTGVVLVCR